MSIKAANFAGLITQPLNVHNFIVALNGVDEKLTLAVSATSFPSEKLRVVTVWHQGEQVRYPGLPENDGSWKVRVSENEDGKMRKAFDQLKHGVYNQTSGTIKTITWESAEVIARDLQDNQVFKVILKGVWLRGRNPIELANNDPSKTWEWEYEFCYTYIEDPNDSE